MFDKMKQLMEMKKQADMIKRELDATIVESKEAGVTINITGSQGFKSIEIDEGLIDPANKAQLEASLVRSVNAAIKASQDMAAQKMKSVLPGGFPGL